MISFKPEPFMVELPNFIKAMKRHDEAAMANILVEHVEYFIENMQKETVKAFV